MKKPMRTRNRITEQKEVYFSGEGEPEEDLIMRQIVRFLLDYLENHCQDKALRREKSSGKGKNLCPYFFHSGLPLLTVI